MTKVTLPNGKVLVGPAADTYLAAQKKAAKEEKKALEAAKKSGDVAAAAELASSKASAAMSAADVAHAEVLAEIRANPSAYRFFHVMAADWESDAEDISSYQRINLGFEKASDAPGPKELHLFIGERCLTDEKIKEMFEADTFNTKSLEYITAYHRQPTVLEMHPSLLKKNGKMALDIPEGAMVAVKSVRNTAQRKARVSGAPGSSILALTDVSINHSYICAVIPKEMEASCIA
jgi:hypothetical protein